MHSIRIALLAAAVAAPISAAHAQRGTHQHPAPTAPTGLMLNVHTFTTAGFGIKGNDVAGEVSTSMERGFVFNAA